MSFAGFQRTCRPPFHSDASTHLYTRPHPHRSPLGPVSANKLQPTPGSSLQNRRPKGIPPSTGILAPSFGYER